MNKWNLTVFYDELTAFEADLKTFEEKIANFSEFQGKLDQFESYKKYQLFSEQMTKSLLKLYAYSHLAADLNLKDSEKQSRFQRVLGTMNKFRASTSYVSPEIISIGEAKILSFINKDNQLKPYEFSIRRLFKQQKHVLSDIEEKLLTNFGPINSIPNQLYSALSLTDRINEKVILSSGKELTINTSNWRSILPTLTDAEDRRLVFEAAFKRYQENKDAFASTYNLVLQNMAANYKSRHYPSALESRLFANDIPLDVFLTLKDTVYENTDLAKRYLALRKKHLSLEKHHTYDRFLTLQKNPKTYEYEEAKELFFNALEGFDEDFVAAQKNALEAGYVDVHPKDGKRTGAYSNGIYGFHPFILLNFNKTLDDVFTLVHEAGHSAHTILAHKNQPLATASYTIFVAEIASTFNERLLADYLLKHALTKEEKIAVIEKEIDGIMATFYRQTLFAHYEYEANKLVEKGIPLNANNLSEIMINLYKHYYDIDIQEEKVKQYVWAYIPHFFHSPFYVYQYASSYSASLKIYQDVKAQKKGAMTRYLELLKSGGSDYPVNQAKKAGADLTKKETFVAVVKRFSELIDQLEDLLEN
ncbi:MAG: oligoendopeptidase F [Acholeplasmataceae bacterium]|jgi:oligoendopeptidase F|nr:oligoendopeptidase F [Acholeplasmataceae bacterium]